MALKFLQERGRIKKLYGLQGWPKRMMEKRANFQKALSRDAMSKNKVVSTQDQNQDLKNFLYPESGRP